MGFAVPAETSMPRLMERWRVRSCALAKRRMRSAERCSTPCVFSGSALNLQRVG